MRRLARIAIFLLLGSLMLARCGSSEEQPYIEYPYPRSRPAKIPLDGQILFPVRLDQRPETYYLVVDTGAFATSIEETLVRELKNGVGVITIDFLDGIVFTDHQAFGADLSTAEDYIGVPIHGLIGQDIFAEIFFGLDYAGSKVTAATEIPEVPPPGFEKTEGLDLPYTLEQMLPVVEMEIGGSNARLIADTGSGVTLLTESFVSPDLLATGLRGCFWHTSYGSDPGVIVRLPDISFGGTDVQRTWAVVVPDDYHLRPVFEQLGVYVDGFLGYPFYRRFYLAIHGQQNLYRMYPCPELDHVPAGEWDRVGIEIRRDGGEVKVDMVFEPSDATDLGVQTEDVLEAVDGEELAGVPLDDIRLMLRGTPGDIRSLSLRRGSDPLVIDVAVDRLLEPL